MSRSKGPAAGIAVRSPGDRRVRMSTVACTVGEKREVVGQTGEVPAPEEGRVLAAEAHAPAVTSEARAANFQRNLDAMVAVLKRG